MDGWTNSICFVYTRDQGHGSISSNRSFVVDSLINDRCEIYQRFARSLKKKKKKRKNRVVALHNRGCRQTHRKSRFVFSFSFFSLTNASSRVAP